MKKKRKLKSEIRRLIRPDLLMSWKSRMLSRDRIPPERKVSSTDHMVTHLYPSPPGEAPW